MLIAGKTGDRLEVEILGYEFPPTMDDQYDSNWLIIRISAKTATGSWTATDPSLLTSEVVWLADWFDGIARGEEKDRELEFLEPNLSFELLETSSDRARLRAWFELELRPTWARSDAAGERDLHAELDVTHADLRRAAEALRTQLRQFPPRGA
jgi:hypothetical protein